MDVSSTPSTKNELIINNFFELFPAFPSQQANNVFAGQKIVVFFAHTALHFPNLFSLPVSTVFLLFIVNSDTHS